jgi:ferritin
MIMISKKMQAAINEQIGKEFYSAYLYLGMAAWFEEHSLKGIAKGMSVQAQETPCHGMIFYNFLLDAGGSVVLPAVAKPDSGFKSALDIFERGLKHEGTVTASINNIVDIAMEEKYHAARSFLNWFVDEQVEEENNFSTIVGKLKLGGDNNSSLFLIDTELSARLFVMPAPLVGKI